MAKMWLEIFIKWPLERVDLPWIYVVEYYGGFTYKHPIITLQTHNSETIYPTEIFISMNVHIANALRDNIGNAYRKYISENFKTGATLAFKARGCYCDYNITVECSFLCLLKKRCLMFSQQASYTMGNFARSKEF